MMFGGPTPHNLQTGARSLLRAFCLAAALAPGCRAPAQAIASPTSAPQARGSVSGKVTDTDGAPIDAALVTLATGTQTLHSQTDDQGQFTFAGVPSGKFTLTITAEGFSTRTAAGTLAANQRYDLYGIPMPIVASAVVQVTASREEIAQIQVKEEETQRLFGALPNFYVTYDWHAAPLNARQKFELGYKSIIDPVNQGINAGIAGIQYADNALSGYGRGPAGYFKRLGADEGDLTIGTLLGGAIFPVLLKQDPRYFYMGPSRTKKRRFFYALSTAVICRGDNGKWQPNYSSVLGDLGAGAASNLYYPKSDRSGWDITFYNGLLSAASDGVGNVIQEFLLKHLTPHAPNYPNTP